MQNKVSDKDILYSMLKREVDNLLQGVPIFSAFGGTISSYLIKLVDPYVTAFMVDENTLDDEQLGEFASEEINNKIAEFKKRYIENRKKGND